MEDKKYFFRPDKKFLKQGFYMEDENKKIIYEAKMTKWSLFGAMKFDFINHVSNKSSEHDVGKTITSEESGLFEAFSTNSRFKFDKKNIWDYLHEQGIRIDSDISNKKLGMTYNVTLKGKKMATIMTSSIGKSIVTNKFCYDVITSEENLDLAFLVTFAFARTEQVFYD